MALDMLINKTFIQNGAYIFGYIDGSENLHTFLEKLQLEGQQFAVRSSGSPSTKGKGKIKKEKDESTTTVATDTDQQVYCKDQDLVSEPESIAQSRSSVLPTDEEIAVATTLIETMLGDPGAAEQSDKGSASVTKTKAKSKDPILQTDEDSTSVTKSIEESTDPDSRTGRIMWQFKIKDFEIPDTGIPFTLEGHSNRNCNYGPKDHKKPRVQNDTDRVIKRRNRIKPSRKINCPACLKIRATKTYVDYTIVNDHVVVKNPSHIKKIKREAVDRLKRDISMGTAKFVQRFYITAPTKDAHKNHIITAGIMSFSARQARDAKALALITKLNEMAKENTEILDSGMDIFLSRLESKILGQSVGELGQSLSSAFTSDEFEVKKWEIPRYPNALSRKKFDRKGVRVNSITKAIKSSRKRKAKMMDAENQNKTKKRKKPDPPQEESLRFETIQPLPITVVEPEAIRASHQLIVDVETNPPLGPNFEYQTCPPMVAAVEYQTGPPMVATVGYQTCPPMAATVGYQTTQPLTASVGYSLASGWSDEIFVDVVSQGPNSRPLAYSNQVIPTSDFNNTLEPRCNVNYGPMEKLLLGTQ